MTGDNKFGLDADDTFGNLNKLNRIINDLDDRALVLSLAAFAEESLGELLKAFLLQGDSAQKLLSGFNAPLGTFSARVKMCHALGLITQHQFEDLERLRKIRNEFAHSWDRIAFTDQRIKDHIRALHFHSLDDVFPEEPRLKIKKTIGLLLVELQVTARGIVKLGKRASVIGQHVIAGVAGTFDEQRAECRQRITEIRSELPAASGDRRRYLLAAKHRWQGKLEIVRLNAPTGRRAEAAALQAELDAWNTGPDY